MKKPSIPFIGQRFGKLTVMEKAPNVKGPKREYGAWLCKGDCGNDKIVITANLNGGIVKSCGCLLEFGTIFRPGDKMNRLTMVSYKDGWWTCKCDCGNFTELQTVTITSGNTQSCGCLRDEIMTNWGHKLVEVEREFEPRIASARRVWQTYCYRDDQCVGFDIFLLISQQNCHYCGIEPFTEHNSFLGISRNGSERGKKEGTFIYNGLDRIDSNKPHLLENILPCCIYCNRAKNNQTQEQFYKQILNMRVKIFELLNIKSLQLPKTSLAQSIKSAFRGYKKDTDLVVEEFYYLSQLNCFYCNNRPINYLNSPKGDKKSSQKAKDNGGFYYNGLDRIDSEIGHTKNNVVPCCKYCNFAKGKRSLEDFQSWMARIISFNIK